MNVPSLEIKNIHKRFGELEVLKGVSITANKGDVIAILGSSGSGKSTLLRCINLLEMPEEGEDITLDGMEMTRNEDGSVEFGEPESPSAGEVGFF